MSDDDSSRRARKGKRETQKGGASETARRSKREQSFPVDFVKIEMASLQRYKRYFKLDTPPNSSKSELIEAVKRHFPHHPLLNESDTLNEFLHANQRYLHSVRDH